MAEKKSQSAQVYHVMIRWTKHEKCNQWDNPKTLQTVLERLAKHWIFQHEDSGNNPHYQGYANLHKKDRPDALAKQLNKELYGVEIQAAHSPRELQSYSMKSDTRVAGPWADRPLYLGADLPAQLWPWQAQMRDLVSAPPDDRFIYWIYDPIGNSGKTKWCKYMAYHHGAIALAYGNSEDLLNLVYKFQNRSLYLFDLTRTKPSIFSSQDLYSVMESVKNGLYINTKYETGIVMANPPHVVVYSNQVPELEALSLDRWKVYEMTHDHQLQTFDCGKWLAEHKNKKAKRAIQDTIRRDHDAMRRQTAQSESKNDEEDMS
jgi:hypothetical protein